MDPYEPSSILSYHQRSSLSRNMVRGASMDWRRKPTCPKHYPDSPRFGLQSIENLPETSLSELVSPLHRNAQITLANLSALLFLAYSVTAQYHGLGEKLQFLSCPSAGALYPCELYLQTGESLGLPNGLYHYDPFTYGLRLLRESKNIDQGLTFYITAIFSRAAWKYGIRAYRYCLIDAGHLLENLLLAARSLEIKLQSAYVFPDQVLNEHLRLDPRREACLAVATSDVKLSPRAGRPQAGASEIIAASRCAKDDLPPQELTEAHAATSKPFTQPLDLTPRASGFPKLSTGHGAYAQATRHRRSFRKFTSEPLTQSQFDMLLSMLISLQTGKAVRLGIMAERVQGLAPGLYRLESGGRLKLMFGNHKAEELAAACLGQAWMAQASLIVLIWADLSALEQTYGPRAYRLAHLLSGQLGQRAYLVASSLNLGCCGVGAFYDEAVGQVLDLTQDEQLLYLLPFGPVRK